MLLQETVQVRNPSFSRPLRIKSKYSKDQMNITISILTKIISNKRFTIQNKVGNILKMQIHLIRVV